MQNEYRDTHTQVKKYTNLREMSPLKPNLRIVRKQISQCKFIYYVDNTSSEYFQCSMNNIIISKLLLPRQISLTPEL